MDISDEEYALANRRGEEMKRAFPSAVRVMLSPSETHLQIELSSGSVLNVPLNAFAQLAAADAKQFAEVEISPSGFGIHFPDVDTDLYVPALLEQFGSAP